MRSTLVAFALFLPLATLACAPQYDLVIRNGDLVDGTGSPARRADVAIKGDRIVAVGTVSGARRTIDASGASWRQDSSTSRDSPAPRS
jgi:hypothetical protein